MANEEHVALLKQGVEAWNQHRSYTYNGRPGGVPMPHPDLRELNGDFLRVFDFMRFVAEYVPAPGEIQEMYDAYRDGNLNQEFQRYGWQKLDNINLTSANLSGADIS